jgi:hypothetical protein
MIKKQVFCDKCGKEMIKEGGWIEIGESDNYIYKDLCEVCYLEFQAIAKTFFGE